MRRRRPEAVRRCPALAHEAVAAGGPAAGRCLMDAAGTVLYEGRDEAYEQGPGRGPLRGTPPAHAETDAAAQRDGPSRPPGGRGRRGGQDRTARAAA
ncbi:hypothetical protein [Streptomyces subrutilus]|uniref:Uncharacterized protein n=1 Tax=Streptomyces subrutilus TaxID=36818 RepID=A0A1E5PR61_9ACTN|nr:hypothetical protein [Streptomyces subrutilus]OEJ32046.1 hypothetical protein BGK67_12470 [Streptomyces subrutilus]